VLEDFCAVGFLQFGKRDPTEGDCHHSTLVGEPKDVNPVAIRPRIGGNARGASGVEQGFSSGMDLGGSLLAGLVKLCLEHCAALLQVNVTGQPSGFLQFGESVGRGLFLMLG